MNDSDKFTELGQALKQLKASILLALLQIPFVRWLVGKVFRRYLEK